MSNFEQIPDNMRAPLVYIEINNHAAAVGLPDGQQNVLMLGYTLPSITAAVTPTRIYSPGQAEQIYGRGSMLAEMARAFLAANKTATLSCLPVAKTATTVAAEGAISVSGTASEAGVVYLMIAGQQVQAAVMAGDDEATICERILAAINALTTLPVTAHMPDVVDPDQPISMVIDARWGGASGNDIDMRINYYDGQRLPGGIVVELTQPVGGAVDSTLEEAIAAMGGMWFNRIINPFTDAANLALLSTELIDRWGPLRMVDGIAFMAKRGNLGATAEFGMTRNDYLFSTIGTGLAPQPPYIWAAVNCAIATASLAIDPARPLQTLVLTGILPAAEPDRWQLMERNALLFDGISTYTVTSSGAVQIERQITMYRTDSFDEPDDSYLDVNTIATLSYIRYATRLRIQSRFPRHKLADDGTRFGTGQPVATPSAIRSELLALFTEFETEGLVEGFDDYATALIVERDTKNRNRVNVYSDQDIVNQFRMYAQAINYIG